MVRHPEGEDPRRTADQQDLAAASQIAYPQVAQGAASKIDVGMLAIVVAALAIGGVTWIGLTAHKETPPAPPPPPPPVQTTTPEPRVHRFASKPVAPPPVLRTAQIHPSRATPESAGGKVLIVDNSKPEPDAETTGKAAKDAAKADGNTLINANDKFAARLSGDVGLATRITHPAQTVPQGAMVPAVLETAVNTDLPGYTRAIVSRDVRSFDGSEVLIPRGSHLIGQYKSGLSSGVTRVFVIWTRLIRPDGLSVLLGSPGIDSKGQTGMSGEVSTHFLKRFGAAMLLSVISGVSSLGSGSTIVIGSSSAQSAASEALSSDTNIPPTIKVAQGTAIQVFVAQDLDFSEQE